MFTQIAGMHLSKTLCDARAAALLPLNLMSEPKLQSFGGSPEQPFPGKDIDCLHSQAASAKQVLDRSIQSALKSRDINPEQIIPAIDANGCSKQFKVYVAVPLKTRANCDRKIRNDYNNNHERLCDIARCTIVVETEDKLAELLVAFIEGQIEGITVVRLKNRFANPMFTGIRDCLMNVQITCPDGTSHIGEIQLHFAPILALKETCHIYYEFFREYFVGTDASYKKRLEIFDKVGSLYQDGESSTVSTTDVELGLRRLLESDEHDKLVALAEITEAHVLGDPDLYRFTNEMLVRLIEDSRGGNKCKEYYKAKANVAKACVQLGRYEEALGHYWSVRRGQEELLGLEAVDTLQTCCDEAEAHFGTYDFSQAIALFSRSCEGFKKELGPEHPQTLSSLASCALFYDRISVDELSGGGTESAEAKAKARELTEAVLKGREKVLGEDDPSTLETVANLAVIYGSLGENEKFIAMSHRVLAGFEKIMGADHLNTLAAIRNLSIAYLSAGDVENGLELARREYGDRCRAQGKDHLDAERCARALVGESMRCGIEWSSKKGMFGEDMSSVVGRMASEMLNAMLYDEALKLYEWLAKGQRACLGEGDKSVLVTQQNIQTIQQFKAARNGFGFGGGGGSMMLAAAGGNMLGSGSGWGYSGNYRGGEETPPSSPSSSSSFGELNSEDEEILRNVRGGAA
jgi:tetratricopeptide (TPR) repeat protein